MQRHEFIHIPEGDPKLAELFAWCLAQGLYDDTRGDRGRMRRAYEGRLSVPTSGASAAVAFEDGSPIGLCLLESQGERTHPARVLSMDSRRKKPLAELPWSFVDIGFLSLYVRPEHRGRGVAASLVQTMEGRTLERLAGLPPETRLMASALEGAQKFVEASRALHLNSCSPHHGNYPHDISRHAQLARFGESPHAALGEALAASRALAPAALAGKLAGRRQGATKNQEPARAALTGAAPAG